MRPSAGQVQLAACMCDSRWLLLPFQLILGQYICCLFLSGGSAHWCDVSLVFDTTNMKLLLAVAWHDAVARVNRALFDIFRRHEFRVEAGALAPNVASSTINRIIV